MTKEDKVKNIFKFLWVLFGSCEFYDISKDTISDIRGILISMEPEYILKKFELYCVLGAQRLPPRMHEYFCAEYFRAEFFEYANRWSKQLHKLGREESKND